MKNYKTYSWDELKDFVNSQKDDRLVNCRDHEIGDIGDVLVHFGRKKLKKAINGVGMTTVSYGKGKHYGPCDHNTTTNTYKFTINLLDANPVNYQQVKQILSKIK